MLLKNAIIYSLKDGVRPEITEEELSKKRFSECLSTQRESIGFIPVMGRNTKALLHQSSNRILMQAQLQSRILPASVVRDSLNERVDDIEQKEDRKVSAREKKELREDIELELLPKAFLKNERILLWVDLDNGLVFVNTSSSAKSENIISLLRKSLGSFPGTPFEAKNITMMSNDAMYLPTKNFQYTDEIKLSNDKGEKANFQGVPIQSEDLESWRSGLFECKGLGLCWNDKISFVINEKSEIKKIKFLDLIEEQMAEEDPETFAEKLDIEFSIISGEMAQLAKELQA